MSDVLAVPSMPVHTYLTGIIQITGEHDTGKTTMALDAVYDPQRVMFLDSDVKGRATVEQIRRDGVEFGHYEDLIALEKLHSGDELAFHASVLELIGRVKPGQFDLLIWDTFRRFEKTFIPVVEAHPERFRKVWSNKPDIRAKERKGEGVEITAHFLDHLQTLFPLVIICTHLRDDYAGDVKTGKQVPDNNRTLERVCRMRIWLKRNPSGSPVPVGLLLKRIDRKIQTSGGLRTVSVLPQKLSPGIDVSTGELTLPDKSVWDVIERYVKNPIGTRKPWPSEMPDAYELSIIEGTLTDDQRMVLKLAAAEVEAGKQAELFAANLAAQRARQLHQENSALLPPVLRGMLLAEIETGELDADPETITIPSVLKWIA